MTFVPMREDRLLNGMQAGNEKYKGLENFIYVGAQRMIVEKGKPLTTEFKFSRVGAGRVQGKL
jgi:hypothetical protein